MAPDALIIGAGPAGLMAAEALAQAGASVVIAESKPSPARKFLMAGKSGLNITKSEPLEDFISHYGTASDWLGPMLRNFGPEHLQTWCADLDQPVFTGSTGRVFPTAMKASPLLRAWLARLNGLGVTLRTRWRWTGWNGDAVCFDTQNGPQEMRPKVTILACGGASWARLGSDGKWASFSELGPDSEPFLPSNIGFKVAWSSHMAKHFGTPLKNCGLIVDGVTHRGEVTISTQGLEGGGLYPLTPALRSGAPLALDLKPDLTLDAVRSRLARPRGKASLSNHLRKALTLTPAQIALLQECARPLPDDIAPLLKHLPIPLDGPRPIDEAISTAGGLRRDALTDGLMLQSRPGTYACGEMLDWEAPTGGYLITACMATGLWAGRHAAKTLA